MPPSRGPDEERPRARVVLGRGLRARCPACGGGRVFETGVATRAACDVCGWKFERCPGHWVGGNEINLLVSFPAGVAAYGVAVLALGMGVASVVVATAATVAFGIAFFRPSRGLFFAIDYLLDPVAADASPPRDGDRLVRRRGPSPRPGGRRRGPALASVRE